MTAKSEPQRGDLLEVSWVDIYENSAGDPNTAELARRTSFGLFWEEREDRGIPVIVTTTTIDHDADGQSGFCIYPKACVVKLAVIKRARRKKQ